MIIQRQTPTHGMPWAGEPHPARQSEKLQLRLPMTRECTTPAILPALEIPPKMKPRSVVLTLPARCSEKGCVFPAAPGAERCLNHQRERDEPALYRSRQPSSAVVARGKFGPARAEEIRDGSPFRGRDRRRLMAERETFLGE